MGIRAFALVATLLPATGHAEEAFDAITGYMDFAPYEAGIILPAQIDQAVFEAATFVDTRSTDQFEAETIPGAIHMDWREVPGRLNELPADGMVILFCNTGSLSAQATFAARVLGHENVLVLQTGIIGWKETAAWVPE